MWAIVILFVAACAGYYLVEYLADSGYNKKAVESKGRLRGKTTADYFTFNVDNSALIIGETGSGKSYIAHSLIEKYSNALAANVEFLIFDHKMIEYQEEMLNGKEKFNNYRVYTEPEDTLEQLEQLLSTINSRNKKSVCLFIYIEECDAAALDQQRFDNAVIKINNNAEKANIKLIYSTSRVDRSTISEELQKSFDLVLAGLQPKINYEKIGIDNNKVTDRFEFQIINNHSSKIDIV